MKGRNHLSSQSEAKKHQLSYHIVPPKGLLNDPNGLIQYKGIYHVFFQWNQHGTVHQSKSWGHVTSTDLVHWEYHEAALEPNDWYDKDGVYSGSAVKKDDTLYLFYTGNVRGVNDSRESYQCLAVSKDGFHFEKKGPLFEHPKGYTRHVRDPKVWQGENGLWYMILGAQREDLTGDAILYTSEDLLDWTFKGSLLEKKLSLGYMWECPDVLQFKEKDLFVFSPQGLEPEGNKFQNIYQTGYLTGQLTPTGQFVSEDEEFVELDRGFEFYAPQSFTDQKNRVISFGWVGVMEPEVEAAVPTIKDGWVHALTIPRELTYQNGVLKQQPVEELAAMRTGTPQKVEAEDSIVELTSLQQEVIINWKEDPKAFSMGIRDNVEISYDQETRTVTVSRVNWLTNEREKREVQLKKELGNMRLFLESSLIELFVNDGEEVFTLRYFADDKSNQLSFSLAGEKEQREISVYELTVQ